MRRDLSYETRLGPKTKTVKSATLGRGVRGAEPPDENKLNSPICGLCGFGPAGGEPHL